MISRPKHVENIYKWNIYLSCCIKMVFSIIIVWCTEPRNWNMWMVFFSLQHLVPHFKPFLNPLSFKNGHSKPSCSTPVFYCTSACLISPHSRIFHTTLYVRALMPSLISYSLEKSVVCITQIQFSPFAYYICIFILRVLPKSIWTNFVKLVSIP